MDNANFGMQVKLNEGGASDAFFIFSESERFIAKRWWSVLVPGRTFAASWPSSGCGSCNKQEMTVLLRMADKYLAHFKRYDTSFLTRILGAHKLRM